LLTIEFIKTGSGRTQKEKEQHLNKTVFLCTGGAAMPEMMRWLWRDSTPVTTDPTDLGSRGYLPPAAVGKTAFFWSFPYVCPEPVLAK
jgi:hypothetical protein